MAGFFIGASAAGAGASDGLVKARDRQDQKERDAEAKREFDTRETDNRDAAASKAQSAADALALKKQIYDDGIAGIVSPQVSARARELAAQGDYYGAAALVQQANVPLIGARTDLTKAQTKGVDAKTADTIEHTAYVKYGLMPQTLARTRLFGSEISLNETKIHDLAYEKPAEFQARLGEQMAVLRNRTELAKYNAAQKMQIARMGAALRLQGLDSNNAAKTALVQFEAINADWRAAAGAAARTEASGNGGPVAPVGQPPVQIIMPGGDSGFGGGQSRQDFDSQYLTGAGGSSPMTAPTLAPSRTPSPRIVPPRPAGSSSAQQAASAPDSKVQLFLQQMQQGRWDAGRTAHILDANVKNGNLSPQEAAVIRLGLSGRAVPASGGQAGGGAVPFLRL